MTDAPTAPSALTALKVKIETELAALNTAVRTSLRHARAIGECLLEAKAALKGEEKGFVQWVKENCTFSYPSAANYMKVAKEWGRFDEESLAGFTIREFLSAVAERAPRKKSVPVLVESVKAGENPERPVLDFSERMCLPVNGLGIDLKNHESESESVPQVVPISTASTPLAAHGVGPEADVVAPAGSVDRRTTADAIPDSQAEDRVAEVARELDIPADKLRAALVKLGYAEPAAPL